MPQLPWLDENAPPHALPAAEQAGTEPNGLLAAGGSLEPDWLLHAYAHGVFPWYNPGEPILWWSPDPRAVLIPSQLHVSRSLRRAIRSNRFDVRADTHFSAVIDGCAAPRSSSGGTWITVQMRAAFTRLHALGHAHCFEAWENGRLVGGLYGLALGKAFFGESMFARADNASKVAFAGAVGYLRDRGVELIDCQIPSGHLTRLGATAFPRAQFVSELARLCADPGRPGAWTADFAHWRETAAA